MLIRLLSLVKSVYLGMVGMGCNGVSFEVPACPRRPCGGGGGGGTVIRA